MSDIKQQQFVHARTPVNSQAKVNAVSPFVRQLLGPASNRWQTWTQTVRKDLGLFIAGFHQSIIPNHPGGLIALLPPNGLDEEIGV